MLETLVVTTRVSNIRFFRNRQMLLDEIKSEKNHLFSFWRQVSGENHWVLDRIQWILVDFLAEPQL